MRISSLLVQGAGSAVASKFGSILSGGTLDALVLLSLGADHTSLLDAIRDHKQALASCPVYLTETYGILGFDEDLKRNVELLEKDRGSEYGFVGGSGGQGCLVLGYSDGAIAGHTDDFPAGTSSMMVVADQSKTWTSVQTKAPLHYGGITKTCWQINMDDLTKIEVPYFWIADTTAANTGKSTGIMTFTEDAAEAAQSLLKKLPNDVKTSRDVGLFPCFTRGVNRYAKEDVESTAISSVLPNTRIYGMFAHGELGPSSYVDFCSEPNNNISCEQHSMSSILSIHTTK